MKSSIDWYFCGILLATIAALVAVWPSKAGSKEELKAIEEGRVVITYWDRHSGHEHDMRRQLAAEFNNSQDKIYVRMLPVGFRYEKMLTAIASGAPPDICSLDANSLILMGGQGCFMPLDDWLAEIPFLAKEKFHKHVYDSCTIDGKVYGIPTTIDTYCLIWNKELFRRAGLDPERPPQTIKELGEYAAKLTISDASGIQQMGFLPWLPWDLTSLWLGFFGSEMYDPATGYANVAHDPGAIAAYQWMSTFTIPPKEGPPPPYMVDRGHAQTFKAGFGAYMSGANAFYANKIAMITEGEWQVTFIPKYAPGLKWGVAPIPTPEGQEPRCYSPFPVVDAIPTGCKHPEEAKTFLKWFHTQRPDGRPSPASDYCYQIHNIPCRIEDCYQERFIGDEKFKVFVDQLLTRPVTSLPNMPAVTFYTNEMDRFRDLVVNGEMTPEAAVVELEKSVNAEVDRIKTVIQGNKS